VATYRGEELLIKIIIAPIWELRKTQVNARIFKLKLRCEGIYNRKKEIIV
jgi:hypothetical protein